MQCSKYQAKCVMLHTQQYNLPKLIQQREGKKQLYLHILDSSGLLVIETRQTIYLTEGNKLTILKRADESVK